MKVKEELRQFAYDNEMDYFGVTPVDRMKDLPEHYRPTDLYPEGKNVIVMGMALSEGVRPMTQPLVEDPIVSRSLLPWATIK